MASCANNTLKSTTKLKAIAAAYQFLLLFAEILNNLYQKNNLKRNQVLISEHGDFGGEKCLDADIPTQIAVFEYNSGNSSLYLGIPNQLGIAKYDTPTRTAPEDDIPLASKIDRNHQSLLTLAEENFENKIINSLIHHLYKPSALHLELLEQASKITKTRTITLVTSFDISRQNREILNQYIKEKISVNAKINYLSADDSVSGIQLWDMGYRVHCDLDCYYVELLVD